MRIVKLQATNVKRLKAVEITPDGNLVVIGGKNGNGKSSLLDSIFMALGGQQAIPTKPVRDGESEAKITIELDEDFVVERRIKPDGDSTLHVRTKNGAKYPSPQALLDGFSARFTFDPLAFKSMKPKEQAALLKDVLGLDFSSIDFDRQQVFELRTQANRRIREIEAQLQAMPQHPDAPEGEVSVESIVARIEGIRERELARERLQSEEREVAGRIRLGETRKADIAAEIERLKAQIAELQSTWDSYGIDIENLRKAQAEVHAKAEAIVIEDASELKAQLRRTEDDNRRVRANVARSQVEADLARRRKAADELTTDIEKMDADKARMLAEAPFPIPGLSFDDNGVSFNGIPFAQLSAAEQLRVSMAMGIKLNPRLKILLIRDGSLLDEDNLRLVAELAEEHGAQVWLERVGQGEEVSVVLEDGSVKEERPKRKEKVGA
jgi:DNA repair exonuclease SbcCD ATPase subunit